MLLQFNPAVISGRRRAPRRISLGGTQDIAIVERVDKERGQAIISATRMPNTPGVSGTGTLVGIIGARCAGQFPGLSIVQVNAKDFTKQRPIQMVTSEAAIPGSVTGTEIYATTLFTTARTATHSGGDDPARIDYRPAESSWCCLQPRWRCPGKRTSVREKLNCGASSANMRIPSIGTRTTRTKIYSHRGGQRKIIHLISKPWSQE